MRHFLLALVVSCFLFHSAHAATLIVTRTSDVNDGTCTVADCSLREAIDATNLDPDADTISFDPTVFATPQTIDLGTSSPQITNSVTITGSAAGVTLLTKDTSHGFHCTGGTINFIDLFFTGHNNSDFGVVCEAATLTLRGCTMTNYGYAVQTHRNVSPVRVQNCTFTGNTRAIYAGGPLSLENSTLSGNTYGVYDLSTISAKNSIVAGNQTDIYNFGYTFTAKHSLTKMSAPQAGLDPAGFKNNGGPTKTFALKSNGPAHNGGDPAFDTSALPTDQRGSARKSGSAIDIGAFEIQESAPTGLALSGNTIASGKPLGTFIGSFSSTDANMADIFTYSFATGAGGEGNTSFAINAAGSLRTAVPVDVAVKSSYSILVTSTDSGGLSFTRQFTITVLETSPPSVTIATPVVNQKVLLQNVDSGLISGTASDNVGVSAVKIRLSRKRGNVNQYWNGTDFTTASVYLDAPVTTVGDPSVSWQFTNVPPAGKLDAGLYQVEAYALDAAGNKSATVARPFTITLDSVKPTVSIATPTVNQFIDINNVGARTISGVAGDDTGVASVKLKLQRTRSGVTSYWNGSAFTPTVAFVDATVTVVGGTAVTWSLDTPIPANQLDAGAYVVYATAYDATGNFLTTPSRGFFISGKVSASMSASMSAARSSSAGGS